MWSYVTVTTVGYGDRFPTTTTGRIVGVLLMTSGVALFGVFTSFLANTFLTPRQKPETPAEDALAGSAAAQMRELRQLLAEQERTAAAIREKLDALERAGGL